MLPDRRETAVWDLRWRFDFWGNRPSKWGKWSAPGKTKEVKAWCQNKEGLCRAAIEGHHRETFEVKTLAECDGHNFVNFQWMALAFTPGNFRGTVRPLHALAALKLITREHEIIVFPDASIAHRVRPEAEKKIHFATFGR
jgi:hypothetical protein